MMALTKRQKRAEAYARAKAVMAADKCKVQAIQAKKASASPNSPVTVQVKKKKVVWSTTPVQPSPAKRQAPQRMEKQKAKEDAMRRAKEFGQNDLKSLQKKNKNNVSFLQPAALKEEEEEEESSFPVNKRTTTKTILAHTGHEPAGVCMAPDDETMQVEEEDQQHKHVRTWLPLPLKLPSRNWLIVMFLVWLLAKCLFVSSSSSSTPSPPQRIHFLEELIQSAQNSGTPVQINLDRSGTVSVKLGFDQPPAAIEGAQPSMNDPTLG